MPIDYKKYPSNWKTEIVPRILSRAKNRCENCGLLNKSIVYAVKHRGKSQWFKTLIEAEQHPQIIESRKNKNTGQLELVPNPKPVKIILTVAHLDHDETNWQVRDERLKALCQKCHLTYDGKEKYLRINGLKNLNP